jgi:hypothetical protein
VNLLIVLGIGFGVGMLGGLVILAIDRWSAPL